MKTKKIIGALIAGILILGSGLFLYYYAVAPKGRATGKVERPLLEIPNINKIFRIADINNDKLAEIILLEKTDKGANKLYIIDNYGNCFNGWPKEVNNPAIGDVNNDGYKEIIDFKDGKLYAYDQFGVQLNGFPETLADKPATIPILVDLDEDSSLEIMWGTKEPGPCINAYNGEGYILTGWPKEIVTLNSADDETDVQMPMAVADINNDGKTEIVVLVNNRIFVLAAE